MALASITYPDKYILTSSKTRSFHIKTKSAARKCGLKKSPICGFLRVNLCAMVEAAC